MELDNFILEKYDPNNVIHKTVLIKLYNDNKSRKYLGNLEYAIENLLLRKEEDYSHNDAYIVFYNERAIGYIALTNKNNIYEIISGLVPEERGYHLGALLLQEFSEKIFETIKDVDKLTLMIDKSNIGSQKTALLAGYEKENGYRFTQKRR